MSLLTPFSKKDPAKEEDKGTKTCPFRYVAFPVPPKIAGGPAGIQFQLGPCPQDAKNCPLWFNGMCVQIEALKRQAETNILPANK